MELKPDTIDQTFTAASPVLTAIDVAGEIVGYVPDMSFGVQTGVSAGLSSSAQISQGLLSYTREKRFVKKMNKELFNPRNLKVDVVSAKKLRVRLSLAPDAPLSLSPAETEGMSLYERHMAAITTLVEPLSFEVPSPLPATKRMDRMNAWVQARATAKHEKMARKAEQEFREAKEEFEAKRERKAQKLADSIATLEEKRARKRAKHEGRRDEAAKLEDEERTKQLRRIEDDLRGDMDSIDEEIRGLREAHDERIREMEEERTGLYEDQVYNANKTYWILVENL